MQILISESQLKGIVKENLGDNGPKINLISTDTLTPEDERMIDKIKKVYKALRKGMLHLQFNNKPLINVKYELPPLNEAIITVSKFSFSGDEVPTRFRLKLQSGTRNIKFEVLNPDDFGYNNYNRVADHIISQYSSMMYGNIKRKFNKFDVDLV